MPGIPGRYELWTWHNSDPDTNRKERCIMMAIKPQAFNAAAECVVYGHARLEVFLWSFEKLYFVIVQ